MPHAAQQQTDLCSSPVSTVLLNMLATMIALYVLLLVHQVFKNACVTLHFATHFAAVRAHNGSEG
jgi:hypothetical protein